jgi:repressor LexA
VQYTRRQKQVMEFLAAYQRENEGMSPTLEEIGEHLGITRVTAFQHVRALERKGAVRHEALLARSIEILDPDFLAAPGVPLLGAIAAGGPIEALETPEEIVLEDLLPTGSGLYVLRVQGESMIEEGIRDGDYVIVERRQTARDGETVVAIVGDNEATLKRLYREKGGFRLQPANPTMEPIFVTEVEIRGVVRGVLRRYR